MEHDLVFLAVACVAVVVLGLSKGGFAGIGMVSTPMVALVSDPLTAVALMLPVMIVQDVVAVWIYRHQFDKRILSRMIPGGLVGVLLAWVFAAEVPERAVQAALGGVGLAFAGWQGLLLLRGMPDLPARRRRDGFVGFVAGAASGFSSAVAHAGPPPFQIYVMPKRLRKEIYVGTSVMFFAAVNALKVPAYATLGLFSSDMLAVSFGFVPLAVLSSWLGARLVRLLNPRGFSLIITLVLAAISIALLVEVARPG